MEQRIKLAKLSLFLFTPNLEGLGFRWHFYIVFVEFIFKLFSLLWVLLIASWKKFHFVYHLWHHGRNAKQSCGFLCVLYMECSWNLQVGRNASPFSGTALFWSCCFILSLIWFEIKVPHVWRVLAESGNSTKETHRFLFVFLLNNHSTSMGTAEQREERSREIKGLCYPSCCLVGKRGLIHMEIFLKRLKKHGVEGAARLDGTSEYQSSRRNDRNLLIQDYWSLNHPLTWFFHSRLSREEISLKKKKRSNNSRGILLYQTVHTPLLFQSGGERILHIDSSALVFR